jgi:hypothetical protein
MVVDAIVPLASFARDEAAARASIFTEQLPECEICGGEVIQGECMGECETDEECTA